VTSQVFYLLGRSPACPEPSPCVYAEPEELEWSGLQDEGREDDRSYVEETLATVDRTARPILKKQVPGQDAYELYGGTVMRMSYRLWPGSASAIGGRGRQPVEDILQRLLVKPGEYGVGAEDARGQPFTRGLEPTTSDES
jgi:hypothetical protein